MSKTQTEEAIADALRAVLVSQNWDASGGEDVNIVDAINKLAGVIQFGLKYLGTGDAGTTMGAIEFLGTSVKEGAESIATAIDNLVAAIRERGES
jgi:hypothetical protein